MAGQNNETHLCTTCGTLHPIVDFYKSANRFWIGAGHLPVCKECMNKLFTLYKTEYKNTRKALQKMCMTFDLYYSDKLYEGFGGNSKIKFSDYMKKINVSQYRTKTFEDSIREGFALGKTATVEQIEQAEIENYVPDDSLVEFWGYGYVPTEYKILQEHYEKLKKDNPNCQGNQEIFIRDLCDINLMKIQAKAEKNVKNYNDLCKQYRDTFEQAGLSTKTTDDSSDETPLGVLIEQFENYAPAEIYQDQELYRDFDGIGDYFNRFVLRSLRNTEFGTTERDPEFSVPEEPDE